MMFAYAFCALLAPAAVQAVAFQWALPEPTIFAPAPDNWSPVPTLAPRLLGSDLFRRQANEGNNTCAYLSGKSESSITCANTNFICATNTQYGVAGCCDPNGMNSCVIPTQCVASTGMSSSCSDAACTSNSAIVKCTQSDATECYRWLVNYGRTTMTQHGCTNKGFTMTVPRSWGMLQSSVPAPLQTTTATIFITPTPSSGGSSGSEPSKPSLGAIIGGTIGACVILSIIAIAIFLVYRRRKAAENNITQTPTTQFYPAGNSTTDFSPYGFPTTTYVTPDHKVWSRQGPVQRDDNSIPHYPGMRAGQYGVVEVDGNQQPVEAPNDRVIYEAK